MELRTGRRGDKRRPGGPGNTNLSILAAFLVAGGAGLLFGQLTLRGLRRYCPEPNVCDQRAIESLHAHKANTPTMGGLFVLAAFFLSISLCADWRHDSVRLAAFVALGFGSIGVADDWLKLRRRRGLAARTKILWQLACAGGAIGLATLSPELSPRLGEIFVPGIDSTVPLGWPAVPLAIVVVVGASNAVNLTDGLDGLACGNLFLCLLGLAATIAMCGDAHAADRSELLVVCLALAGATASFLWFNRHPARVFLGDTGSLPLGALLGWLAVAARLELMLLVLGGVFVVEALSVILQVASYRLFGRRLFRCAPLHHHFQLAGWTEPRVVRRFWLAGALCLIVPLGALAARAVLEPEAIHEAARSTRELPREQLP